MEKNGPRDPMSELVGAAVASHEMYLAYLEGGFTEQQALYLVAQTLAAMAREGA